METAKFARKMELVDRLGKIEEKGAYVFLRIMK